MELVAAALKYGGIALSFILSLITGRKDDEVKQAGRDAQTVDDGKKLNQEVMDAKAIDADVAKSSAADNAAELQHDWQRK